jgi:hypothetical protein
MKIKKIGLFKKHNSGTWAINIVWKMKIKYLKQLTLIFQCKIIKKNSHINPTKNIPKATIYALKLVQLKIGYPLSIIQTYQRKVYRALFLI